jgi:predicted nucleic acid-binding protein
MIVLIDANVLIDVFLQRQPHYSASAAVLTEVFSGKFDGVCASHCLTTIFYVIEKRSGNAIAHSVVDRILRHMDVVGLNKKDWLRVQALGFTDFEDSAVSVTAELAGASFIVTNNIKDFARSTVPVMTPTDFGLRFIPAP